MPATLKAPEKPTPTAAPSKAAAEPDYLAAAIAEELGEAAPAPLADESEGAEEPAAQEQDPESQPETEADPAATEEAEEPAAEEEAPESPEEPEETDPQSKLPVSVQKRIDGLTAEKKRLAEKVEIQESELAKTKSALEKLLAAPVTVTPSAQDPLANVLSIEDLNQKIAHARSVKRWALENLSGGTVKNDKGEDVEVSPEDVRRHLAVADELLTEHAPRRVQYLRELNAHEAEARKTYPELFDPQSEQFAEAVQILKQFPELMRFPDWKLTAGDFITARRARLAKAKAGAAAPAQKAAAPAGAKSHVASGKPVAPVAPRVQDPTTARSVTTAPSVRKDQLKKRAAETGEDADMEAFFMAEQ